MTVTNPSGHAATNEVAAVAAANLMAEARVLLDKASGMTTMTRHYNDGSAGEENGFAALRTALAGNGQAMLAVAFELAALRAEVHRIGDVAGSVRETAVMLEDRLDGIHDVLDSGLFEITNPPPRPRWWQRRRRADPRSVLRTCPEATSSPDLFA